MNNFNRIETVLKLKWINKFAYFKQPKNKICSQNIFKINSRKSSLICISITLIPLNNIFSI